MHRIEHVGELRMKVRLEDGAEHGVEDVSKHGVKDVAKHVLKYVSEHRVEMSAKYGGCRQAWIGRFMVNFAEYLSRQEHTA